MKIKVEHSSTKESQLKKKLLMYSLAAGVTISFSAKAHGAIQYTDIADITIVQADLGGENSYFLDLNNDETPEFQIAQSYSSSSFYTTTPSYATSTGTNHSNFVVQVGINNGYSVIENGFHRYVAVLNPNDLISNGQNFEKCIGTIQHPAINVATNINSETYNGSWRGQNEKFEGVRFRINGNVHYGWVRLSVAADCKSFTVYDYAYEDVPDRGIKAGQTEGTLPVELSAFTAQFLNNKPTLYWSSQSETDNMGWYIYRNMENDFSSAKKISDLIEGNGSTTQSQSYIFEDEGKNLEIGQTYYYWLESIDYAGMINHYDLMVQLTIPHVNDPGQNITPPISYNIHFNPNPIIETTHISFATKEAGFVEGSIYNVKGELVRSFDKKHANADENISFMWDGKNDNEVLQSNGIYFFSVKVNGEAPVVSRLILMK